LREMLISNYVPILIDWLPHSQLLIRSRTGDVRTLAVSPRRKAAGDEIMHKDAAGHDRGPERHLASERVSTITSPMALRTVPVAKTGKPCQAQPSLHRRRFSSYKVTVS
jgi:hypothetical protein